MRVNALGALVNIAIVSAFLPNINFLYFLEVDVVQQPIGVVVGGGYLVVAALLTGRISANLPFRFLALLAALIIFYLPTVLAEQTGLRLLMGAGYFVGPITFWLFYRYIDKVNLKVVFILILFQLSFCFFQLSDTIIPLGLKATSFVETAFAGYKTVPLAGGRGVWGTYAEPSHLGRYAILAFALFAVAHVRRAGPPSLTVFGIALSLVVGFASYSASFFALLLAFFGFVAAAAVVQGRIRLWPAAGLAFAVLCLLGVTAAVTLAPDANIRFANVLQDGVRLLARPDFSVYDLQAFGGYRLFHTAVGYGSIWVAQFGNGISGYIGAFQDVAAALGIDLDELWFWQKRAPGMAIGTSHIIKPNAYGAQLVFDFGVFGVFLIGYLVLMVVAKATRSACHPVVAAAALTGLLQIILYSSTAMTAPWLMLALLGVAQRAEARGDGPASADRPSEGAGGRSPQP